MWSFPRYVVVSTLAAAAVIYHAFYTREQYFASMTHLSTSKLSMAVLCNMAFAVALCLYRLILKVFLGTLRDVESERLNERLSSAIMETFIAMTIFRDGFDVAFLVMFATMTFIKIFHWLAQDRVDYVEITPHIPRLQHLRIISFMLLLLITDVSFLQYTLHKVVEESGHTVMLLFAFEYLIQISSVFSSLVKYCFATLDGVLQGRWESKGIYVFYLELLTDLMHLCVYLIFFGIVIVEYGLPIHLLRDLYWTIRNFRNRVRDFLRYRRVTSRMDLFPNANEEDLARCDNICIVCREEMTMETVNKKLPCSHVFHLHCLRSWFERQQNCPVCRSPVSPPTETTTLPPADNRNQDNQEVERPQNVPALLQDLVNGEVPLAQEEARPAPHLPVDPTVAAEAPVQQPIPNPADLPQGGVQAVPLQQRLPQWNGQQLGVVWNYPNVLPITSMATFVNGQIQYAGQQSPEPVMNHTQQGMAGVPVVPVMSSFSAPITLLTPQGSSPESHRVAAAAAVAAAAYSPYTGLVMMPPVTYIPQSGSSSAAEGTENATTSVAQAAAAASAASGMAAAFSGTQQSSFGMGEQPSMEATMESVQRQLEFLNAQMTRTEGSNNQSETQTSSNQASSSGPSTSTVQPNPLEHENGGAVPPVCPLPSQGEASSSSSAPPPVQETPPANEGGPYASELRQRRVQRFERREESDV